jgi:tetratricopeptide (TPR) repeat protein
VKLTAAQALALAEQALDRGEAAAAEQICRRLLEQQATRPEAWYLLGAALQRQQRPAEACFDTLLEQQPAFAPGHQRRGTALKALGRLDEALASLARALALQPDYPQAHCNRGNVLLELQQFERALQAYDEALRQRPDLAPARSNRQLALHGLGNQHLAASRWGEALQCFDALLAGDAGHVDALCNRGTALQELGRLDEAIAAFEQALERRPGDAQLHFNLANALHAARDKGARAEPVNTGARMVALSPGVSAFVAKNTQVYAFYQRPVYQHVNGVQLSTRDAPSVGVSHLF